MTSNADQAWADMKNLGGEKYAARVKWILNGSKPPVSQRPVSKQPAVAPEANAVGEEGREKSSTGVHSK